MLGAITITDVAERPMWAKHRLAAQALMSDLIACWAQRPDHLLGCGI